MSPYTSLVDLMMDNTGCPDRAGYHIMYPDAWAFSINYIQKHRQEYIRDVLGYICDVPQFL